MRDSEAAPTATTHRYFIWIRIVDLGTYSFMRDAADMKYPLYGWRPPRVSADSHPTGTPSLTWVAPEAFAGRTKAQVVTCPTSSDQ